MASIYIGPYVLCERPVRKGLHTKIMCPNGHHQQGQVPYCSLCGKAFVQYQVEADRLVDVLDDREIRSVFNAHTFNVSHTIYHSTGESAATNTRNFTFHRTEYVAYTHWTCEDVGAERGDDRGVRFHNTTMDIKPHEITEALEEVGYKYAALIELMRGYYGNAELRYGAVFISDEY